MKQKGIGNTLRVYNKEYRSKVTSENIMALGLSVTFWLTLLILVVGLTIPVQAGVNAQLGKFSGNPVFAALVSFAVGTLALLVAMMTGFWPWPSLEKLSGIPFWAWLGGLLGALFVLSTLIAVQRLGAATMLSLIVVGQMISSLYFDHYGMLGFPHHPVSPLRIAGAALLIVGVVLIRKF